MSTGISSHIAPSATRVKQTMMIVTQSPHAPMRVISSAISSLEERARGDIEEG